MTQFTSLWPIHLATATTVVLLAILYTYAKYKLSYWSRRGVKAPATHLICGNFKDTVTFRKPPGLVLLEIHESVESKVPYVGFYIFHKACLLIRDLEIVKHIFVKDFDAFPNRWFGGDRQKDSLGLVNLLGIHQPRWKYVRSKMGPILTGQKLRRMLPLMRETGIPMTGYIDEVPEDAEGWKEFELKEVCAKYTTDVISSLAFGITTNSFDVNDTAFWKAGMGMLNGFARRMVLLILFFVPECSCFLGPWTYKPAEYFRAIFRDSFETRQRIGNTRGDFIDSFVTLKNAEQNPDFVFDEESLFAQAIAFYVAGYEATSTAIAFTLYELAANSEYQDRVYREMTNAFAKDGMTFDALGELHFLEQCVREAARLHPALPMIDRIAERDYEIPGTGLTITKGTPVSVSINGIHRDPRYFSNPNIFDPRRFDNVGSETAKSDISFGAGPRSCIGQRIGQLMIKVAVATILKDYTLGYKHDGDNMLDPLTPFTATAAGIFVRMKKRA